MRILLLTVSMTSVIFAQSPLVLRFIHLQDAQAITETGTIVRSAGEIRDLQVDAHARMLTVSGPRWQTDLAAWLFPKLDRPVRDTPPASEKYEIEGQPDPSVRVVYPVQTRTPQELSELMTTVRSAAEIRRGFVSHATWSFVMRGTPDEMAAAEWLLTQLDGKALPSEIHILPNTAEGVMRVFWLQPSLSIEQLHQEATAVRAQTRMRRTFTYTRLRTVVVRGTSEQVTMAERLFRDRGVLAAAGLK